MDKSRYVDKETITEYLKHPQSKKLNNKLKIHTIDNGILSFIEIGSGVLSLEVFDEEGNVPTGYKPNLRYPISMHCSTDSLTKSNDIIIYLGCMWNCWGHYFTDGLSKAWYFLTEEYKLKYRGKAKIAVSFINGTTHECPKQLLSLYKLLGIEKDDIILIHNTNSVIQYRRVVVPDSAFLFHEGIYHYTKEYALTIESITKMIPLEDSRKYEKIYLSRTHFTKGNADFGEKNIEKIFRKLGYTIVHPQELSVIEQLSIFKTAKSFVSTVGSLGHNCLWCNPGTEVILLRKSCMIYDCQLVINEVRNLDVTYIDSHLTCFVNSEPNNGPFYLYRNSNFCRFIKDRFGLHVTENFSTRHYMRYMRICLMRPDMKNRTQAPEYYFNKLREELQNDSWKRKIAYKMNNSLGKVFKALYYRLFR